VSGHARIQSAARESHVSTELNTLQRHATKVWLWDGFAHCSEVDTDTTASPAGMVTAASRWANLFLQLSLSDHFLPGLSNRTRAFKHARASCTEGVGHGCEGEAGNDECDERSCELRVASVAKGRAHPTFNIVSEKAHLRRHVNNECVHTLALLFKSPLSPPAFDILGSA
jgi:hypothetical protein